MALIEFTEKLMCGIPEIDGQHTKLIAIINDLYNVALGRANIAELERVFDELASYLDSHLAFEEKLFEETAYPKAAKHKAEHDVLRKKIAEYRAKANRGPELVIALDLLHFLKQWLTNHILVADKAACAFLNERGLI